jgi:hypothetical protein
MNVPCGIWAVTEARTIGRGGITIVSRATDLARTVIYSGLYEVEHPGEVPLPGFGRPGEAGKTQRSIIRIFPGGWKARWNRWSGGTQNPPSAVDL